MARRKGFKITYEIITPESAAEGDVEEQGWLDEEGYDIELDDYDIEEELTIIDKAVEYLRDEGVTEFSGSWWTAYGSMDMYSGETENRSYHPYGFTDKELDAIADEIG